MARRGAPATMTPSPLSQPPTKEGDDMHTLAPPALPVNPARAIAGGLCLVCTTLAPLSSHAFTYDVLAGSVIVQHQSTGTPLVWPTTPIAIRLELGDAGRALLNGTASWMTTR